MNPAEPSEAEIADFIDGRLDDDRRAYIERWLAGHPERAAKIERQRRLNEALKCLGAEILDEPVPERLRNVLRRSASGGASPDADDASDDAPSRSKPRWLFKSSIAAAGLVALGVATGWLARSGVELEDAVPAAAERRAEVAPDSVELELHAAGIRSSVAEPSGEGAALEAAE